jgi:hypothetical protein
MKRFSNALSFTLQACLLTTVKASNEINHKLIRHAENSPKKTIVKDLHLMNKNDDNVINSGASVKIRRSSLQSKIDNRADLSFVSSTSRDLQSCSVCTSTYLWTSCGSDLEVNYSYDNWGSWAVDDESQCLSFSCCSLFDAKDGCCKDPTESSCKVCTLEHLWSGCPDGYIEDEFSGNWGEYSVSGECYSNHCCSDYGVTTNCCSLDPRPRPVPVPLPVPVPVLVPVVTNPPQVLPPMQSKSYIAVYIAAGVLVPVIVGLGIAVAYLLMRRKKAEIKKDTTINTIEATSAGEAKSQSTPTTVVNMTPPIQTMQTDEFSVMTEDNYNKAPGWNTGSSIPGIDEMQPGKFYPVVQGSIVDESVATKSHY